MINNLKYPVIVIAGTNASGKSSLGIDLAQKYQGEIISADSRQIFRGFDLCCGKVTMEERKVVPHHMIDICDIEKAFSVSEYQSQVYKLIPEIVNRGKIPFIVGGTGLYIDAIVKGYRFDQEVIDYEYRRELETKSITELQSMVSEPLQALLKNNNSDYNNKRRLIRIIEKEKNGSSLKISKNKLFNTLKIGVTWQKEELEERIDIRLANRIEQGMIDEIRNYLDNNGDPEKLYNLGLEYKYITWYIEGKYKTIDEFFIEMSRAIKRFAKQQIKWFKRDASIHWLDMTKDYFGAACNLVDNFLQNMG